MRRIGDRAMTSVERSGKYRHRLREAAAKGNAAAAIALRLPLQIELLRETLTRGEDPGECLAVLQAEIDELRKIVGLSAAKLRESSLPLDGVPLREGTH